MDFKILKITKFEKYYEQLENNKIDIFLSYKWLKLFEEHIEILAIFNEKKIISFLPIYNEKKFFFKILKNPPFTPYIGPFINLEATNKVKVLSLKKKIYNIYANILNKETKLGIVALRLHPTHIDMQSFIWKKFKVIPNYTYRLNLNNSEKSIFSQMTSSRRGDIRKALKDNLRIVINIKDKKVIYNLVLGTLQEKKLKINKDLLQKIILDFSNIENSFNVTIYNNQNKVLATAFCLYDSTTAYYLFGGINKQYKHHGAQSLALWECIKYAKKKKLQYFDFEGSMNPSIEKFFRGFGGEIVPYFGIYKANILLEIGLKIKKREIF